MPSYRCRLSDERRTPMPAPPLPTLVGLPLPVALLVGSGIVLLLAALGAAAVIRAMAKYRAAGVRSVGPPPYAPAQPAVPVSQAKTTLRRKVSTWLERLTKS